jgi:hypothetical protein
MSTKYADIIMYLDAIAAKANANTNLAPHKYWWHVNQDINQAPLAYCDFTTGTVYGVGVPIINQTNPLQSLFYLLLSTPGGTGGYKQMPDGGPYITDQGYSVKLSNGIPITGAQIMANLAEWLGNGYSATPKELHVCAGLNACAGHGRGGGNACAGTGDCATVLNDSCHGNNDCRGQGACGGGGSLGSQQTGPGENLCCGKGSCRVPAEGIDASRIMRAFGTPKAITGIYEGRHVWQVARLLFEQRMMASGRTYTDNSKLLGGQASVDSNSAATMDYLYFGSPPANKALGPGTKPEMRPDEPLYKS